ncbi:MAG TPA: HesA/MoeB/ThiF family protein [Steroidobacteraceae bacterium]|nr:HesA/MoeB/ThiF family protein [Steroidobacteraceae bacterium]
MTDRYARQSVLPQIGAAGQARLAQAHVLVAGAGGLGCALLPYLAAAGVGQLTIFDPDRVELCNLHRQPMYRMDDLGAPKAQAARAALLALNPQVNVTARCERLTPANVAAGVAGVTIAVDAADSLALTYMLSDACRAAGIPLVSAQVLGLAGYVGVFCGGAPSYRAVFPEMPLAAGSCAQNGVLGTAVGVMGTLQAHLTLALLLGLTPSPLGRLISIDFQALHFGGFGFCGASEPAGSLTFIAVADLNAHDVLIDLRSVSEAPASPLAGALRLDVETLERTPPRLPAAARVVLCCRSGVRAWRAARALQRQGHENLALLALGE